MSEIEKNIEVNPLENVAQAPIEINEVESKILAQDALNPEVIEVELSESVQPQAEPELGNGDLESDAELMGLIKNIPDKMAFKIGEAAEIIGVKQYVLRYWETEFEALRPKKSAHNQRMYTRKDVEMGLLIKKLLYKDRFSIEGARKALKDLKKKVKVEKHIESVGETIDEAMDDLRGILSRVQSLRKLFQ